MKKLIGQLLMIVWILSLCIAGTEEPGDFQEQEVPVWVFMMLVGLWFSLPLFALKLMDDKNSKS